MEFSKNVMNMDVSGVRKMFEMAKDMDNPINFTVGLPDFDVPKEIKDEAIKAINEGKNRYTSNGGIPELIEKVKDRQNKKHGTNYGFENIMITCAASGSLNLALSTTVDEGDEILIIDPYFVAYKQIVLQMGGIPVFVKTNDDFSIDIDDLKSKLSDKTKVLIINSPSNPTGKVYSKEELKSVINIIKEKNIWVISDEVYDEFCFVDEYHSVSSIYEKTIIVNGFSKSHAMTGWRVGFLIGPKDLIDNARKVQQFSFVCAPTPFQYAALKCFDVSIEKYVHEYKKKKEFIFSELSGLYDLTNPDGAFYMFIKYPYDADTFISDCIKRELLVVPGNIFSETNDFFRISFACDMDTVRKGVDILKELANSKN